MNRRKSVTGLAVAILVFSIGPASANSDETSTTYAASYEVNSGAASQTLDETMTIRRGEPQSFLSLTSSSGAKVGAPTSFGKDGEIQTVSTDPSVTCYNMAAASLYENATDPSKPGFLYIRAGDGLAQIPLMLTETKALDGAELFVGTGQQMLDAHSGSETVPVELSVAANIRVMGDVVTDVTFGEATAVGSASNVVSRQACSLHLAEAAGATSLT